MSSKKNKPNHQQPNVLLTSSEPERKPEYKAIMEDSAESLSDAVNQHIKEGWEVFGGVAICIETSPYHSRIVFSQALLK